MTATPPQRASVRHPGTALLVTCLWMFVLGPAATANQAMSAASSPRLFVNGEYLTGVVDESKRVQAFLGIPFAQPPVAGLRWRAPVEYRGQGGTRSATAFALACMQSMRILEWYRDMTERFGASRSVFGDLPISEDCLYLNVWTPTARRGSRLAVMVYVHGGSNKSGWSFEPNYDGSQLAAQGVVVVSVAYRLGVFGFFAHPQLGNDAAQANFALWDLLAALRWVQRHSASFGGDPGRVTVFGESAGAGNIAALMLSPAAGGLMRRAILQSGGGFGLPRIRSLAEEQARGLELARGIEASAPLDVAALRALPAEQLLQHSERVFPDFYHAPVIDGTLLTGQLDEQLRRGDGPVRDLLIGTNANEYYSHDVPPDHEAALATAVANADVLNNRSAREALRSNTDIRLELDRLQTADGMLCPSQWLATETARTGREVWMYRFARVRDGAAAAELKAYHGAELPYVFGTHDAWLPTSSVDRGLTRQMMAAWVRFARTGSPDAPGLPRWPAFQGRGKQNVLQWDLQTRLIDTPEPVLCGIYNARLAESAMAVPR